MKQMTVKDANELVGGLSAPGKMPCPSFSISAFMCQTGERLSKIPGSVCSKCYARKGRYIFANVQNALERRWKVVDRALNNPDFRHQFIESMAFLISRNSYFRWHDSGDLQSVEHFRLICDVAEKTSETVHWLPTKEPRYVKGKIPSNLIVRVSAPHIDQPPPKGFPYTSTVVTKKSDATCPAIKGACGPCRLCWQKDVPNVAYMKN